MNGTHVAFFTEAGYSRGMGHLIRSFTISEKFRFLGIKTSLFLDSNVLFDDKFKDITYFDWSDFELTNKYDIIFIDSYEANIEVYRKIASSCKVAVYIDDFKRLNYPKGIILNFAPDADKLFYKLREEKHSYLLGLKYLPIRDAFTDTEITKKKQIFIMLGGSDVVNLSLDLIHTLKDITIKKLIVSNDTNTENELKKYKDVEVLYKPSDMQLVKAMASSTMAISTASMSAYELAYLKIPTIIVAVAKNQEIGVSQFIKHNLASDYVSIESKDWQSDLMSKVKRIFCQDSHNINQSINGRGTENIASEILELLK
jgi:spore coat polysaccharide biosynthesis predicted glycosyltransferase SpsG